MRGRTSIVLLVLLGTMLLAGIAHLFQIRFTTGDTYPPYSTLRSDPLGTRVLYEAVKRLRGMKAERAFAPLSEIQTDPATTLLIIGLTPETRSSFPQGTNLVRQAMSLADNGTRVVIGFSPYPVRTLRTHPPGETTQSDGEQPVGKKVGTEEVEVENGREDINRNGCVPEATTPADAPACCSRNGNRTLTNLLAGAGIRLVRAAPETTALNRAQLQAGAPGELPAEIPCQSIWNLIPLDEAWRVVYQRNGQPVVLERTAGQGSIVLCGDSFALGNEALWRDRVTPYLVWLLGDSRRVVFLESHHGLRERVGIMMLIRRFRLQGVLAGLAVLAALFIWQQQALPEHVRGVAGSRPAAGDIAGRDVHSGLTSLLKRAVPPRQLNATCVALWRTAQRSHDRTAAATGNRLSLLLEQPATRNTSPVRQYHDLCRLLKERKQP